VDIFVVEGGFDASLMQKVTRTIPIVTTMAGDLVLSGVAVSLARPGGNITGIQTVMPQLIGKHLSLLKDTIPLNLLEVTRVRGVLTISLIVRS
jgi:putative ABC transport system substrate-binding protein